MVQEGVVKERDGQVERWRRGKSKREWAGRETTAVSEKPGQVSFEKAESVPGLSSGKQKHFLRGRRERRRE